jgi:hypothetical protein
VTYEGAIIGTLPPGVYEGGDPLVIALNNAATAEAVQALLRHVRYENTNANLIQSPGPREITFTLTDGDGGDDTAGAAVTVDVTPVNDAPKILTDDISVASEGPGPYDTTVLGLIVSDVDSGVEDVFTLTVKASHGSLELGMLVDEDTDPQILEFHGTLQQINEAFASGVTYVASPEALPEDSDAVTFTVKDALGATDNINFIFNVTGVQAVDLEGTTKKDVIFATGHDDTLTGLAGNDTFVFSLGEQNFGADTIIGFKVGDIIGGERDKIMLIGGPAAFGQLDIDYGSGDAVITFDANSSITLPDVTGLTPENFVFRPGFA